MTTAESVATRASVANIVNALDGRPVDLATLLHAVLPHAGLYAWWQIGDALPGVPAVPHPTENRLGLLYVGIGPASASSRETLNSRLVGKHIDGNTGSSTLRLTLASHLTEMLALIPRPTAKKVVLDASDNNKLTQWMYKHLRVTWVGHKSPWDIEEEVIAGMKPPLNIDHNRDHPYCPTNQALRGKFKARARSG
jgi:hypothetical protein